MDARIYHRGRADLAIAVARRWDELRLRTHMYRRSSNRDVSRPDLSALRMGDPDHRVGLERLVALASWLGIEAHLVTVPMAIPEHVTRALATARPQAAARSTTVRPTRDPGKAAKTAAAMGSTAG